VWSAFWIILFFLAFASFCVVSTLIAWKGIDDLKQLFLRLQRSREDRPAE
jgi:hypothetical protein